MGASRQDAQVRCLGRNFSDEGARRGYFRGQLALRLQEPDFRETPGFPLADDATLLALSDPPWYTACPNPFLGAWLESVRAETPADPGAGATPYRREPFAADVREGKSHPIYNAHSYHTKVPHAAIMRYILHFTRPGDVVLDGFCGSGMTGVAAAACGSPDAGLRRRIEREFAADGLAAPAWGHRHALLVDLSPAASFIAGQFNTPASRSRFEAVAGRILAEVAEECGWMFATRHTDGRPGRIHYTLWSDVFLCPECGAEILFWHSAVDHAAGRVRGKVRCGACRREHAKKQLVLAERQLVDPATGREVRQAKQFPVLIVYSPEGSSRRFEKSPDAEDLRRIERLASLRVPYWFPRHPLPAGGETRRNAPRGITHVHHFYTPANLYVLAAMRDRIWRHLHDCPSLGMWFTSTHAWTTRLNRFLASNYFQRRGGVIGQTLQNTLYISSLSVETNGLERFRLRLKSVPHTAPHRTALVGTGSSERLALPDSSVDYIFVDPPFGANIAYSELNSLWEAWLGVRTNAAREAIENRAQGKSLDDYRRILRRCFREFHRVLKPGRWITVEFSNTRAAVWDAIQESLQQAGFVVARVTSLEKTHKAFRAVTMPGAVKQDLVISAYKPPEPLERRFRLQAATPSAAWEFVTEHLRQLPVRSRDDDPRRIPERGAHLLYDRMVAFHIQHGARIPLSSAAFHAELPRRFAERDGMYFLPEQVAEYERTRGATPGAPDP